MRSFKGSEWCNRAVIALFIVCSPLLTYSASDLADTVKVNNLLLKADELLQSNVDSAEYYTLKAGDLAQSLRYELGIFNFYTNYIDILDAQGRYSEALQQAQNSLAIATKMNSVKLMAMAYSNIGHELSSLGNLELAAKNYLQAMKSAEAIGDSTRMRTSTNNLASVFTTIGDKKNANIYAMKGYELAKALKDSAAIASSLVNLANSEILYEHYDKATAYFHDVITIGYKIGDVSFVLDAYINLGHISKLKKEYEQALKFYLKGAEVLTGYPVPDYQLYVYWGLAESYYDLNNYTQAEQYLQKSLAIAREINAIDELIGHVSFKCGNK